MSLLSEDRTHTVTLSAAWNGTGTAPAGSVVEINDPGASSVGVQITGTMSATVQFEGIIDEVNGAWFALQAAPITPGTAVTSATAAGRWLIPCGGLARVRARCSTYVSGSPFVCLRASLAPAPQLGSTTISGGGLTSAVTMSDGADTTFGAEADASAAADNSTATFMSLFKRLLARLTTLLPQTGGRVNVDGTGGAFPSTVADGGSVTFGAEADAAAGTDTATATYMGLFKRLLQRLTTLIGLYPSALTGSGNFKVAVSESTALQEVISTDGALTTLGTTTDAAVTSDTSGTAIAFLRGIAKVYNDVWNSTRHGWRVEGDSADGSGANPNPVIVGGYDGSNPRRLLVNTDGSLPVGGFTKEILSIPTITASSAYATGNLLGGKITLSNAVRLSAGSGAIQTVAIFDKDFQKSAIDIVFFSANPSSTFTDHANFSLNNTDLLTIVGTVSILTTDYVSFNSANSVAFHANVGLGFALPAGTTLYACLVCRGTPTYTTTSSVQLAVVIAQD